MNAQVPSPSDQFLSRRQLAVRWGVSIASIKRLEKSGKLRPYYLNSRTVRFRASEVQNFVDQAAGSFAKPSGT